MKQFSQEMVQIMGSRESFRSHTTFKPWIKIYAISSRGVGIVSCTITNHFVPAVPTGRLRIVNMNLPTATRPLEHEVTLLAMDNISDEDFAVRWVDASDPAPSQLYASLGKLSLRAGQRIRVVPKQASAASMDDALILAGGPGINPPATGAVYQLFDADRQLLHEAVAVPMSSAGEPSLVAFPNPDGTRAFLVPPQGAQAIPMGYWTLEMRFVGDAGPDRDQWSIGGTPIDEQASLGFMIL